MSRPRQKWEELRWSLNWAIWRKSLKPVSILIVTLVGAFSPFIYIEIRDYWLANPYKILVIGPETGRYTAAWQNFKEGLVQEEADLKDYNSDECRNERRLLFGNFDPRDPLFCTADHGGSPDKALKIVRAAIENRDYLAVIGPATSTMAAQLLEEVKANGTMPLILPMATTPSLLQELPEGCSPANGNESGPDRSEAPTNERSNIFRLVANDCKQIERLTELIGIELAQNNDRVSIVRERENEKYSRFLTDEVRRSLENCSRADSQGAGDAENSAEEKHCGKVVAHGQVPRDGAFERIILDSDLIFYVGGQSGAALMLRQAKEFRKPDRGAPRLVLADVSMANSGVNSRWPEEFPEGSLLTFSVGCRLAGKCDATAKFSPVGRDAALLITEGVDYLTKTGPVSRRGLVDFLHGLSYKDNNEANTSTLAAGYEFDVHGENEEAGFHTFRVGNQRNGHEKSKQWLHVCNCRANSQHSWSATRDDAAEESASDSSENSKDQRRTFKAGGDCWKQDSEEGSVDRE